MRATIEDVEKHGPCEEYTREKLAELWAGRESLSVRECSELPVSFDDRVWGMIRIWPRAVPEFLDRTVERAVRRKLGKSGVPEWGAWAEKWLSGEDRSVESAAWAAEAAWAEEPESAAAADAAAERDQQMRDFVEIAERVYGMEEEG